MPAAGGPVLGQRRADVRAAVHHDHDLPEDGVQLPPRHLREDQQAAASLLRLQHHRRRDEPRHQRRGHPGPVHEPEHQHHGHRRHAAGRLRGDDALHQHDHGRHRHPVLAGRVRVHGRGDGPLPEVLRAPAEGPGRHERARGGDVLRAPGHEGLLRRGRRQSTAGSPSGSSWRS